MTQHLLDDRLRTLRLDVVDRAAGEVASLREDDERDDEEDPRQNQREPPATEDETAQPLEDHRGTSTVIPPPHTQPSLAKPGHPGLFV